MKTVPSLSERYHEATKYTPENVRGGPGLDFSRQPPPFKAWQQETELGLPNGGDERPDVDTGGQIGLAALGALLFHTYGVTLVREHPGVTMHYRAAPSAGALYPTELYVAVRDVEGVPDGIHAYDGRTHRLVPCWEGSFWGDLSAIAFEHPAVEEARILLIGSAVFERSAWRYRDRGYRRVLLDAGHVFGGADLAARPLGLRVVPIGSFSDGALDELLLLDGRQEASLALGAVVPTEFHASTGRRPAASPTSRDAAPSEGAWIPAVHAAGRIERPEPPGVMAEGGALAHAEDDAVSLPEGPSTPDDERLWETLRTRRSTRRFRRGPVPVESLGRVLRAGQPRPGLPGSTEPFAPDLLETTVVVSAVTGIEPGVYRYDPRAHALRPARAGNPRMALHRVCLLQDLGHDCAFAVVHTVDLHAATEAYGDRAYRLAHLEAGRLGQALNVAALQVGLGASGIGGFFDDFVNDLIDLPERHAIAYITTIGEPA